jgi:hypothetical protein
VPVVDTHPLTFFSFFSLSLSLHLSAQRTINNWASNLRKGIVSRKQGRPSLVDAPALADMAATVQREAHRQRAAKTTSQPQLVLKALNQTRSRRGQPPSQTMPSRSTQQRLKKEAGIQTKQAQFRESARKKKDDDIRSGLQAGSMLFALLHAGPHGRPVKAAAFTNFDETGVAFDGKGDPKMKVMTLRQGAPGGWTGSNGQQVFAKLGVVAAADGGAGPIIVMFRDDKMPMSQLVRVKVPGLHQSAQNTDFGWVFVMHPDFDAQKLAHITFSEVVRPWANAHAEAASDYVPGDVKFFTADGLHTQVEALTEDMDEWDRLGFLVRPPTVALPSRTPRWPRSSRRTAFKPSMSATSFGCVCVAIPV